MNSFGDILQAALSVAAIAALGGIGYLRGTVSNLRATLVDVRADLADADRKIARLASTVSTAETLIIQQRRDLEALARIKTGEDHWIELGILMNEHHESAKTHWLTQENQQADIVTALTDLARIITERGIVK